MHLSEIKKPSLKKSTEEVPLIQNFLQKKCPLAYTSKFKIYRGIDTDKQILYGDSSKHFRASTGTKNYYNFLISKILPEWRRYPDRSYSFICSTDENSAGGYGELYRVYPVGDPLIAIAPEEDVWDCFPKSGGIREFASILTNFSKFFGVPIHDTWPQFSKEIQVMDKKWAIMKKDPKNFKRLLKKCEFNFNIDAQRFNSFTELLSRIFDPVANQFKLVRLSEAKGRFHQEQEIWFSGPAYFLRMNDDDY